MMDTRVPVRLGRLRTRVSDAPARAAAAATAAMEVRVHSNSALGGTSAMARVCRVCTSNTARYTCPRCNLPYCSVPCYRSHGEACTESFYEAHVTNEMAFSDRATASEDPRAARQREAAAMLQRVHQFQVDHESHFDATAEMLDMATERLERLAVVPTEEMSLEDLTEEERTQFLAEVASGRLSQYVSPWQPWWRMAPTTYERETSSQRYSLITEVATQGEEEEEEDAGDTEAEPGTTMIAANPFPSTLFTRQDERAMPSSMSKVMHGRSVSPLVRWHLIEILFAYALMLRTFNGDWRDDADEAALTVLDTSSVLRDDARFSSLELVVQHCLELRALLGTAQPATNALVMTDVLALVQHRVFLLDALTDLLALVRAAAQEAKRTATTATAAMARKTAKRTARQLAGVAKKLEFYRMWSFHAESTTLRELTSTLTARCAAVSTLEGTTTT